MGKQSDTDSHFILATYFHISVEAGAEISQPGRDYRNEMMLTT